jgi:hypothetical protein
MVVVQISAKIKEFHVVFDKFLIFAEIFFNEDFPSFHHLPYPQFLLQ